MRQRLDVPNASDEHLETFAGFGSNPGHLNAKFYVPKSLPRNAPLVVVLHGCTQTASSYDRSAGWSRAADEHGFGLLFPEQQRSNNPNLCFNWFSPADARRGEGEALSIRQMVAAMQARHATDPARVFVSGLSAGGAMAAVMMATYPDVFAGGAVIAGLPFGTARSVPEAFDRMRGHGEAGPVELAELVRSASSHSGPWPILSVWHGTSDVTVDPSNARALVDQWRTLHGLTEAPSRTERIDGYAHRVWNNDAGRPKIEDYIVSGMGHGTPLSTSGGYGEAVGPHMLEAGISSTRRTLAFWGIGERAARRQPPAAQLDERHRAEPRPMTARAEPRPQSAGSGIQKTIEDALRSAGLLR
jgi:poly(hydroxyalkanoate) depolymerase family esterase